MIFSKRLISAVAVALSTIAFLFVSGCAKIGDEFWLNVKKGNILYSEKKFDAAMKSYHDAELSRPESPELRHNMGNVFYRQKNYEKAAEAYTKAMSAGDEKTAQKARYNMGNVYFRQDKLEEAIKEYKQAVEMDSADVQAKYNLEFARIKLKEKLRKQQKEKEKNQKKDPNEKNKLPDKKNQKSNPNCPNPKQSDGGGQGQKKQEQQKQQAAGKQGNKEAMPKDEALRILKTINNKEKDDKKSRMAPVPMSGIKTDKDW